MQGPFYEEPPRSPCERWRLALPIVLTLLTLPLLSGAAFAHAVAEGDKGYIQEISGINIIPFIYLGAKHMVTGYDHILFLFGVIFFLYKLKHISVYVSLFCLRAFDHDAPWRVFQHRNQQLHH